MFLPVMDWNYHTACLRPPKARSRVVAAATLLLIAVVLLFTPLLPSAQRLALSQSPIRRPADDTAQLPADYATVIAASEFPGLCSDRYGVNYIREFSRSATEYCANSSTAASLRCFSHTAHDERTDSFCFGMPATVHAAEHSFELECDLRDWATDGSVEHSPPLSQFPLYWYDTGPRAILDQWVHISSKPTALRDPSPARTLLLVRREEAIANMWHVLMEVMSLSLSLDILRTTADPSTGLAMYTEEDARNTQLVILDDWEEGPFWEIWAMFAGTPVKFDDVSKELGTSKIVIPLPGGSNPLWEGDWVDLPCEEESALLHAFSKRVLRWYDIAPHKHSSGPLTLTLIDRRGTRRLLHHEKLFADLQAAHTDVKMQLIDLADMSLKDQLFLVHTTDILVGVHGAGLTHGIFMHADSTLVEIQPPGMGHKGFKNMARFLGHRYFVRESTDQASEENVDWHFGHVSIESAAFLELVGQAIAAAKG